MNLPIGFLNMSDKIKWFCDSGGGDEYDTKEREDKINLSVVKK